MTKILVATTFLVTMVTLSERLRWLRATAGLTVRKVDELAGLTLGHSSQIENETIGPRVSARTLFDIASVFGAEASWLLDGVGDQPTVTRVKHAVRRAFAKLDAKE